MPRYIALLRGINVGGHRVKMTDLKQHFENFGLTGVETFIASGNVFFESGKKDAGRLEEEIGSHLRATLGYEVPTFIRTPAEIAAVAAFGPFPELEAETTRTLSVMFTRDPTVAELQSGLEQFETEVDRLRAHGREIYWLSAARTSDTLIDWTKLGKQLKLPLTTVRNITTVRRMAEKYPPDAERKAARSKSG